MAWRELSQGSGMWSTCVLPCFARVEGESSLKERIDGDDLRFREDSREITAYFGRPTYRPASLNPYIRWPFAYTAHLWHLKLLETCVDRKGWRMAVGTSHCTRFCIRKFLSKPDKHAWMASHYFLIITQVMHWTLKPDTLYRSTSHQM